MVLFYMPINISIINQLNLANQIAVLSNGIFQNIGQSNWAFLR